MSLVILISMNESSYANRTCDSNRHIALVDIATLALDIVVRFISVTESVIAKFIP